MVELDVHCQPACQNLRLLLSTPPLTMREALMKSQPTFSNVTTACCHICTTSFVLVGEAENFLQRWKLPKLWLCWRRETSVTAITIDRGISLLSVTGKVFARVLLPRLQKLADRIYPESQCGFPSGRSTTDMIFFHFVKSNRNAENKLKNTSPHSLCGPHNTFWHGEQGGPMCYPSEIGMSTNID